MKAYLAAHNAAVEMRIFIANVEAWIARELGEEEGELRW